MTLWTLSSDIHKDGSTVQVDAAYHQQITNAFRNLMDYGKDYSNITNAERQALMDRVYSQYPLPPGTKY
jgi:hypothetical protein